MDCKHCEDGLENTKEGLLGYLTKEEQEELKVLNDPRIKHFSSSWNPLASFLFSPKISKFHKNRIIELKTKARIKKEKLDENEDKDLILKIRKEEERNLELNKK